MNSAKLPFKILQYLGIWQPKSWSSPWAIQLYHIYSFLMVVSLLASITSFSINTIQSIKNLDSLTENLFPTMGFYSLMIKVFYVFTRRADIIVFDDMFLEIHCRPRDVCELSIIEKFDHSNRWNTKLFLIVSFATALMISSGGSTDALPAKMWIPYSTDSKFIFWFTYLSQMVITFTVIILLVALDCCIAGLMQQICAQLEILYHRICLITDLNTGSDEIADVFQSEFKIKNCIEHHSHLYLAGQRLNNMLSATAFLQFFVTISALCTIVYQLSITGIDNVSFWIALSGSNSFLFEIFLLCWYGQEVIDKSLAIGDATFQADWTSLTHVSKKYLIVMSMRAEKPIQLCAASFVTLGIETFLKILKVTYSTFNLMQSLD